ncbi:uncharacterized protein [Nicotiana sylvestris]|uniref:uncharacterized protein n=1 Tax=Nicotiana sylvestris TaxID=4096 RepID=UPI00388C75B4
MARYEALYGRQCRSPIGWFKPGEARLSGTDLVQDALEKVKVIQERLRRAQSRQKSYADRNVRDMSYMVGEKVLLKVSPMKGVMIFGKKVAILGHQVRKLRSKDIASVKVQWRDWPVEEATWDTEREMRRRYPHIFEASGCEVND